MSSNASPHGVAAVLSHKMPAGEDRPATIASKIIAQAEQNYSDLEIEALGVVFRIKKFHEYCFGRLFTIQIDHKALLCIIGEHKSISNTPVARIQRWSLFLSNYNLRVNLLP